MNRLPESGFVRIDVILGNPALKPPIPPIIPIGKTAWWAGIKEGKYPPPLKLGPRTTVWRVSDIKQLIESGEWKPAEDAEASV